MSFMEIDARMLKKTTKYMKGIKKGRKERTQNEVLMARALSLNTYLLLAFCETTTSTKNC